MLGMRAQLLPCALGRCAVLSLRWTRHAPLSRMHSKILEALPLHAVAATLLRILCIERLQGKTLLSQPGHFAPALASCVRSLSLFALLQALCYSRACLCALASSGGGSSGNMAFSHPLRSPPRHSQKAPLCAMYHQICRVLFGASGRCLLPVLA